MTKVADTEYGPAIEYVKGMKEQANALADTIENKIPPGRRRSLALTHLETALMWATKAAHKGDE